MKKKRQGFTLIELLAVIVILGLLMAIAIPSVTKYITQSRKKTVTTTIGNYISALTNQVNDMEYVFTGTNTIYAVPIECISLERGGTNPFGEWHQASDAYWAYVLIQYDDTTSSYTYGFTFKDSAGYGLYPTTSEKLNGSGKQINTDLDLTKPTNGTISNITAKDNWTGFDLEDDTKLVVLEAESDGVTGNGQTTCTLCQKGNNYEKVEKEKEKKNWLSTLIKRNNNIITQPATLNKSSSSAKENGLYVSTETDSGSPTYYFRGKVTNNYVSFAGYIWRIVRINEDGTTRIILLDSTAITNTKYDNAKYNNTYTYYYSRSNGKTYVDSWYNNKIKNKGFDSFVATGTFCESFKVVHSSTYLTQNAKPEVRSTYVSNFKCGTDGNGFGVLNLKVGLINIDEIIHAGAPIGNGDANFYLYTNSGLWTMSPGGKISSNGYTYHHVGGTGNVMPYYIQNASRFYPVINLSFDVIATGAGTSSDPYVVQTN